MGVANSTDFDDGFDDFDDAAIFEEDETTELSEGRRSKLAWRSVEDYLADKRLKEELSDVFDDEWYA